VLKTQSVKMSNFKAVGCTKYEYGNCPFTQYSDRNGVKYVRCDQCLATGVIRDESFRLTRPHTCRVNEDLQFDTVDIHVDDDDTVSHGYSNNIDCVTSLMRKPDHKAYDLMWKHPFTSVVSGPTSCGKTIFIFKLIENMKEMITPAPTKTVYCYGEYQPLFDNYPRVEFHEGLPDITMFDGASTLLILDWSTCVDARARRHDLGLWLSTLTLNEVREESCRRRLNIVVM
jgi:hypothetical protein